MFFFTMVSARTVSLGKRGEWGVGTMCEVRGNGRELGLQSHRVHDAEGLVAAAVERNAVGE